MPATPAKLLKDNLYGIGPTGFVYTTDHAGFGFTRRHAAVVMLTAHGEPFELVLADGERLRTHAAVVGPLVKRRVASPHGQLLSFNLMPSHGLFQRFVGLPAPGARPMDRQAFSEWDERFTAMRQGTASLSSARQLFDLVLTRACDLFTPTPPSDPLRCEQLRQCVSRAPDASLAHIAQELGLLPGQVMALWPQAFGMPCRDHHYWRQHHATLEMIFSCQTQSELASATGFSDAGHLTRVFRSWYGQPPSFSRNREQVRVFLAG